MPTAIARQLLTQARVTVPLDDDELSSLAWSVDLHIAEPIPLPDGVGGLLYHGAFHPRRYITRVPYRTALVYAIARHHLFHGAAVCFLGRPPYGEPEPEEMARIHRSALLAGALALGADYEPATSARDLADVAEMAEFPAQAILDYQMLLEKHERQRDQWRFPELGRELRRTARLVKLVPEALLALAVPLLAFGPLLAE